MRDEDSRAATRELRDTLFPGIFRKAVLQGRAQGADREAWRELYLEDPEAFSFAMAYDWLRADEHVARSKLLWRV